MPHPSYFRWKIIHVNLHGCVLNERLMKKKVNTLQEDAVYQKASLYSYSTIYIMQRITFKMIINQVVSLWKIRIWFMIKLCNMEPKNGTFSLSRLTLKLFSGILETKLSMQDDIECCRRNPFVNDETKRNIFFQYARMPCVFSFKEFQ
jgi:hypothetical protein